MSESLARNASYYLEAHPSPPKVFCAAYQPKDLQQGDDFMQKPVYTVNKAFKLLGCKSPPQIPELQAQLLSAARSLKLGLDLCLSKQLQNVVVQELRRQ